MPDEKPNKYEPRTIPTYEEATSSRVATPQQSQRGRERGDNVERQGLLNPYPGGRQPPPTRRQGYRPPPTDNGDTSDRDSLDGIQLEEGRRSHESGDAEVRTQMLEMDVEEPAGSQNRWTKHLSSISQSISSRIPGLGYIRALPRTRIIFNWPKWDANLFILLGRFFAIFLVAAVVYLIFISDLFTSAVRQLYEPESVRIYVQENVRASNIRTYLEHITSYDHLAGTKGDYALAQWVERHFKHAGSLDGVRKDQYDVYLNYPKEGGQKVALLGENGQVTWEAKIEEERVYPDRVQTPVFHGHSRSGNVTGPLIYANYGSREDFKRLYDSGIATEGAIALVRYHGAQGDRALKVKAAEDVGFAGCIIYSDPADDGFLKGEPWPKGRYMPSDGVQRGAVSLMSWVVGDVLTPGEPSIKGTKRVSKDNNPGLTNIPSIPLSWRDAQPLLQSLKGNGQPAPEEWHGGVPDVDWWSGNLSSPKVWLMNLQDENEQQPIWNVVGHIQGIEQREKKIVVGNHRDAWAFGASDPGSGTAVFLEVIRIFGDLVDIGWRPLRTIEFASWDGEEYNLIGSTEHVENHINDLRENGFAYLNVDVAVKGDNFRASASPIFQKALLRVLGRTSDPMRNQTLLELWNNSGSRLEGLGAGSDYVAFQDIAGTSSIDIGFDGPPNPYHSVYDNFEWMDKVGDPGFQYHAVLAQVWALLILEMADELVVPFDMKAYSAAITKGAIDLQNWVEDKGVNQEGNVQWNFEPLREAVLQFDRDAAAFSKWELDWETIVYGSGGFETSVLAAHRLSHNTRMANFETHLLDLEKGGGIPGREQFKHILFAPQAWSGYEVSFFPAIRDAVEKRDWALAQKQIEKAAGILKRASHKLVGNT